MLGFNSQLIISSSCDHLVIILRSVGVRSSSRLVVVLVSFILNSPAQFWGRSSCKFEDSSFKKVPRDPGIFRLLCEENFWEEEKLLPILKRELWRGRKSSSVLHQVLCLRHLRSTASGTVFNIYIILARFECIWLSVFMVHLCFNCLFYSLIFKLFF